MGAIKNGYEDIDCIKDPDGVCAVISRRTATGAISFALYKEYEREGTVERTSFMNEKHVAAAHRLLDRVVDRIKKEPPPRQVTGTHRTVQG